MFEVPIDDPGSDQTEGRRSAATPERGRPPVLVLQLALLLTFNLSWLIYGKWKFWSFLLSHKLRSTVVNIPSNIWTSGEPVQGRTLASARGAISFYARTFSSLVHRFCIHLLSLYADKFHRAVKLQGWPANGSLISIPVPMRTAPRLSFV